eukprot:CAMPEP_0204900308 /NCGR_PEP_ID=MMETSP1397-20131031/2393_1 /ASSEMBLY_ACC=CAM_ASM_000891 /TAXON_ID=49980 /ORGANISM="Climacostomum Climacostomum virens, Strain Stock W-24" /LENGTH=498 /DNA_ID=CAMNT_0052068431 /DNA_START=48 /DNA_END=1541 /DNA_ORIENTATION=+
MLYEKSAVVGRAHLSFTIRKRIMKFYVKTLSDIDTSHISYEGFHALADIFTYLKAKHNSSKFRALAQMNEKQILEFFTIVGSQSDTQVLVNYLQYNFTYCNPAANKALLFLIFKDSPDNFLAFDGLYRLIRYGLHSFQTVTQNFLLNHADLLDINQLEAFKSEISRRYTMSTVACALGAKANELLVKRAYLKLVLRLEAISSESQGQASAMSFKRWTIRSTEEAFRTAGSSIRQRASPEVLSLLEQVEEMYNSYPDLLNQESDHNSSLTKAFLRKCNEVDKQIEKHLVSPRPRPDVFYYYMKHTYNLFRVNKITSCSQSIRSLPRNNSTTWCQCWGKVVFKLFGMKGPLLSVDTLHDFASVHLPPMLKEKENMGLIHDAGYMYSIGGRSPKDQHECSRYCFKTSQWERVGSTPAALEKPSLVVLKSNLFAVSRNHRSQEPKFVMELCLVTSTWRSIVLVPERAFLTPLLFAVPHNESSLYMIINKALSAVTLADLTFW